FPIAITPSTATTPLRRLQNQQQTTPTPHGPGRALRDITQSHLQTYEYQAKPVTVRVLSSSSDNENDVPDENTEKTTKAVSRKRPRDPSDVSPISKKEANREAAIHDIPRRPYRPALSPFNAIISRQMNSRRVDVSIKSILRDFISTERNVYAITIQGGYPVPPFACAYSNNANEGKLLAVADEDGAIAILDTQRDNTLEWADRVRRPDRPSLGYEEAGRQIRELQPVGSECVLGVFSSADGGGDLSRIHVVDKWAVVPDMVVTGSRDGSIMLWDVRCTGVGMVTGETRHKPIDTIRDAHLLSYSTPNRKKRRTEPTTLSQGEKSVTAVLFPAHEDHLVASAGAADGLIKYWDIRQTNSNKIIPTPVASSVYDGPSQRPRGRYYAVSFIDFYVAGLSSLTLDNSGSRLFTVSLDNQIYMYDAHHLGKPTARFGHDRFHCASFYIKTAISPDDQFIASGSADHSLAVWEIERPDRPPVFFKGHTNEWMRTVCRGAVAMSRGLQLYFLDLNAPVPIELLATCSDDATVRVWNMDSASAEKYRNTENWDEMVGVAIEGDEGTK
ncbi:WD40-repeat-containing domain protein, partial [Jimgerdemannia flammicorona]